jgi:hypothetical protein
MKRIVNNRNLTLAAAFAVGYVVGRNYDITVSYHRLPKQ